MSSTGHAGADAAPPAWRRDAVMMAAIVLVLCAATIAFGERIGINGGQGWDGMAYTEWAGDFWHKVIASGLTRYHSQRVLPSAVIHYALRLAQQPTDIPHVIHAFQILDAIALIGAAVLWAHLGNAMRWSRLAIWAGFVAVFGNFANARHALYYPTLTDPFAFCLGMAMVWGYLLRRGWVIWLVAALGAVTWPALLPIAIALLVLPRREPPPSPSEPLPPPSEPLGPPPNSPQLSRSRKLVAAAASCAAAIAFVAIGLHYLAHPVPSPGIEKFAQWVNRDLLPLALVALLAMLALGGYAILAQPALWDLRGYLRQLSLRRTAIAIAAAAVLLLARAAWLRAVATHGDGWTSAQFICEHTLAAIRGPLWGLVFHVVYFGPILLIAVVHWRRIAAVCAGWGPAAALALALILAFAAGSQSRQWNHLAPFLIAATIAATEPLWTRRTVVVFTALSLVWSKLWLHIGYDVHDNWLRFPNQRYFMQQGPWASDQMYLAHAAAAVVTLAILAIAFRRATTARDQRTRGPHSARPARSAAQHPRGSVGQRGSEVHRAASSERQRASSRYP